jgi:hypothetical protein
MEKTEDAAKANRLARVIAGDISLYHEDKIAKSLEDDDFFEAMRDELEEGYSHFKQKVSHELVNNTNILERAIIDLIVATRKNLQTKIF